MHMSGVNIITSILVVVVSFLVTSCTANCSGSVITVSYTGESECLATGVNCDDTDDCNVTCTDDYSCSNTNINGPEGYHLFTVCDGSSSCQSSIIDCEDGTSCSIICNSDHSCNTATVYCPKNSDGDCIVDCNNGQQTCQGLTMQCYSSNGCSMINCGTVTTNTCVGASIEYISNTGTDTDGTDTNGSTQDTEDTDDTDDTDDGTSSTSETGSDTTSIRSTEKTDNTDDGVSSTDDDGSIIDSEDDDDDNDENNEDKKSKEEVSLFGLEFRMAEIIIAMGLISVVCLMFIVIGVYYCKDKRKITRGDSMKTQLIQT